MLKGRFLPCHCFVRFVCFSHPTPDMKLVINQHSAYPFISSQINPADKRWGILADEQTPLNWVELPIRNFPDAVVQRRGGEPAGEAWEMGIEQIFPHFQIQICQLPPASH